MSGKQPISILLPLVCLLMNTNSYGNGLNNHTKGNQSPVYTAETARKLRPIASSPSPPQISTEKEIQSNLGFLDEPNDFSSILPKITDFDKSVDFFPDFFNGQGNPYNLGTQRGQEPFGPLTSAASNYNSKKHGDEYNDGFVDPSVQFRSLFDTAGTDGSFQPTDFLGYNGENSKQHGSKSSSTKAYPSFTYSGRRDEEESRPSRYDTPQNSPGYDNSDYYRGDSSPRNGFRNQNQYNPQDSYNGPRNVHNTRTQSNEQNDRDNDGENTGRTGQYDGTVSSQESVDAPESAQKPENTPNSGKGRCKKVEKEVDYEEEYNDFAAPENYDPSSYQSRYKRQAGQRGNRKSNKRPMTCYVCEAEDGRYAERCSYDSNSDPKKGSYYRSSSTSFVDNGKPKGGRERSKRQPYHISNPFILNKNESLPKKIQKRQSEGNRYASDFQQRTGAENGYSPNTDESNPTGPSYDYIPSVSVNVGTNYKVQDKESQPANNGSPDYPPLESTFGFTEAQNPRSFSFDFGIPKEFQVDIGNTDTSNTDNRPIYSGADNFGRDFDIGYDDYVRKHFPDTFQNNAGSTRGTNYKSREPEGVNHSPSRSPSYYRSQPPTPAPYIQPNFNQQEDRNEAYDDTGSYRDGNVRSNQPYVQNTPSSSSGPYKEQTHSQHNFAFPPSYPGTGNSQNGLGPQHLQEAISSFNQKDRKDCHKVQKGDMTCYICRNQRGGTNNEECMYASNPTNPQNGQMAYEYSSEYSSNPNSQQRPVAGAGGGQGGFFRGVGAESKVEQVTTQQPPEYDFDY